MRLKSIILAVAMTSVLPVSAEEQNNVTTISDIINKSGIIFIEQPTALDRRIAPKTTPSDQQEDAATIKSNVRKTGGFRVQVFSDNNAKTAKNEARAKAKTIASAFPQYPTYVIYSSPYWRLKVGDFHTQEEAETAANQIKRAFPSYAKEIRVVRDRINTSK